MEIQRYHSNTQRRAKEELVLYPISHEEQAADILQHNNLNPKDFNGNKKMWLSRRTLERSPSFSVFSFFAFTWPFLLSQLPSPPGCSSSLQLSSFLFLLFPFSLLVSSGIPLRLLCFSLIFLLAASPFLCPRQPTSVSIFSLIPSPSIQPILGLTRR